MPNFIKRVRQVANERWDLPDAANAIMELVAEGIARAEAGDLGVAEGVLSRSEVTFEEPSPGVFQLRFGGCLLYGCKPDDTPSNLSTATPVVYDPTNTNQIQSTVTITGIENGEGSIWWSVELVPYELANRRIWEESYPDGRIQPINTRMYPRITFELVSGANFSTPPAVGGPWYRFAAVDFNDEPPTTVLCHALDYGFEQHAFTVAAGTVTPYFWLGQVALANRAAGTNSGRSYSVARLLTTLSLCYLKTLDSTLTFSFETGQITNFSTTDLTEFSTLGIQQLEVYADGIQTDLAALTVRVDDLETEVTSLGTARVLWYARVSAAGSITQGPYAAATVDSGTTGIKKLTFDSGADPSVRVNNTGIPNCTIEIDASPAAAIGAVWQSTYVLWVYTGDAVPILSNLANEPFTISIVGEYG